MEAAMSVGTMLRCRPTGTSVAFLSPRLTRLFYVLIFLAAICQAQTAPQPVDADWIAKDFKFTERVGASFTVQFTNVFNHFQPSDPSSLSLTSNTTFGRITGAVYAARQMELGLRIHF